MKNLLILVIFLSVLSARAQDTVLELSSSMFDTEHKIELSKKHNWLFKKGNDLRWASPEWNTVEWDTLRPNDVDEILVEGDSVLEGWFRMKISLDENFDGLKIGVHQGENVPTDIYIDGVHVFSFGNTGLLGGSFEEYKTNDGFEHPLSLTTGEVYLIAIHIRGTPKYMKGLDRLTSITGPEFHAAALKARDTELIQISGALFILIIISLLFWLVFFQHPTEKPLLFVAVMLTIMCILPIGSLWNSYPQEASFTDNEFTRLCFAVGLPGIFIGVPITFIKILRNKVPLWLWIFVGFVAIVSLFEILLPFRLFIIPLFIVVSIAMCIYYTIRSWKSLTSPILAMVWGLIIVLATLALILGIFIFIPNGDIPLYFRFILLCSLTLSFPISLLVYLSLWLKASIKAAREEAQEVVRITEEKNELVAHQNVLLEKQVVERTSELNESLENLKSTQSQLIQSEKMASLGELTAGIAHEIQNPLNFVNNFSEVSTELVDEMNEELDKGDIEEAKAIGSDLKENLEKINHHGNRAGDIVKGMLQHSRAGSGTKEPTDINSLADEYLRLAYHGLRAKDKSFNATMQTDFDESLEKISIVPQDIGRVILNLITNAFYVVNEKQKLPTKDLPGSQNLVGLTSYEPTVSVSTKKEGDKVLISVKDNGNGIPQKVLDKIFQPFFTTKPTGQGTGLGLSLSYDIVKAHGGELRVNTEEGKGSEFIISLPV